MRDATRDDAAVDWTAIERLPEFQELTRGRQRFAAVAGGLGLGCGALYVVLASTAHGLMGTKVAGSMSLGFVGGVGLILLTWAITLIYMRRSNRVWGPLEARIREQVLATTAPEQRFARTGERVVAPRTEVTR